MSECARINEADKSAGWKTGWKNAADFGNGPDEDSFGARPKKIPGCVWRHPKTGGFYWTLRSTLVPTDRRGKSRYTKIPLVPAGKTSGATKSKAMAQQVQKRLWQQFAVPEDKQVPRSLEAILEEFRQYNSLHASVKQARTNTQIARRVLAEYHDGPLYQFGAGAIQQYLAHLKESHYATRSIQAHRNSLHKFCRYLVRRGILDANPTDLVEVAAPAKTPPRYLDDLQQIATLNHLSQHAPEWLFDAACVALYAGCRLGSLVALQCQHVQPGGLVVPLNKTGNYTVVPLDDAMIGPQLKPVLHRIKGSRTGQEPLFGKRNVRKWARRMADLTEPLEVFGELEGTRAGNQWHLLRSTWAVNVARRGATLWQLMAWGGWTVPTTCMRYINLARAAGRVEMG